MQIVTGYRGQAHITSNDDQGRNQGTYGEGSYVLSVGSEFAPTLVSANELRIADGEAVIQGVHFRVDPSSYDSVTITNGTQGMNRKDLVVCRYTKDGSTGVESCEWVVIEGTPTSGTATRPSAVSGDILNGALVADMPFFEIVLSGINVTAVNSLFSKLMTMQEIQALAKTNESGISELNSNLLSAPTAFTPHLYDLNTKLREFSGTGAYWKVGRICFGRIQGTNLDFSGISTMMQLRNMPCYVLGGTFYCAGLSDNGGTKAVQSAAHFYLRPNIKSSDFTNATTTGVTTISFYGYFE